MLTIAYYVSRGELQRFEFQYTLALLALTVAATVVMLRKMVRVARS